MRNLKGKLFSLIATSTLGAAYYLDGSELKLFASTVFTITVIAVFACALILVSIIGRYDNGEMEKGLSIKTFKSFHGNTWFDSAFNFSMSALNIALLVLIGSPVLAAFYLLSALVAIKLRVSCSRRYDDLIKDK